MMNEELKKALKQANLPEEIKEIVHRWLETKAGSPAAVFIEDFVLLLKCLFALDDQTRWRRVEEELPKDGGLVIGAIKCLEGFMSFPIAVMHTYGAGWITWTKHESIEITHWRPLPDPPEPKP
jgi:hypothetical protein